MVILSIMEAYKRIKLSKRGSNGRIVTNRSFRYFQMRDRQLEMNKKFFGNFFLGAIRRKALDVILSTMSKLTDMDREGNYITEQKLYTDK